MLHKGRPPEGVTLEGARRHAQLIAAYWAKRGFDVAPRVEEVASGQPHGMALVWGVRSNMVNGMPQRVR